MNDLWLLSGKTVITRRYGAASVFVDYENTLPEDLKPVVICDAFWEGKANLSHWSKGRGDLGQPPIRSQVVFEPHTQHLAQVR